MEAEILFCFRKMPLDCARGDKTKKIAADSGIMLQILRFTQDDKENQNDKSKKKDKLFEKFVLDFIKN